MKKNDKVSTAIVPHDDALEELRAMYPTEPAFNRTMLPRLAMVSQDKTEGKGKQMKVVAEAGTFFIEHPTGGKDPESGKVIWDRQEVGTELEAIIVYQRKQLRSFDESTETFTSSPIFDNDDEIVPLFANKAEIARGTPAELKARPEFQITKDGKTKSTLEDNRILYVLYEDEVYQLNLRGSSMFSFMTYRRELNDSPSTVVTHFSSEAMEKGSIAWNKMTFEKVRSLKEKEIATVLEKAREIRDGAESEKRFFANKAGEETASGDRQLKSGKF